MGNVLAIDLGASNGRLILAAYNKGRLTINEIHRFSNEPVVKENRLFWDIDYLYDEILKGLNLLFSNHTVHLDGISVDTWGVDFGMLSKDGRLLQNPLSYRNEHTLEDMNIVNNVYRSDVLFEKTGVESSPINTLYQLHYIYRSQPELLREAESILTLPNLFLYLLSGEKTNEFTHASTTQLLDPKTRNWNSALIKDLFPKGLALEKVKMPLQILGETKSEINSFLNCDPIPVILVPGHDTACAHTALPSVGNGRAFMNCGTWVLLGVDVEKPVVEKNARLGGFTNEGNVNGTFRIQKNNMGLWLLQKCKKEWETQGIEISFDKEKTLLKNANPFQSFIDPDDPLFFNPPSMIEAIQTFCANTGQAVPQTEGAVIRCIMESLAMKYRWVINKLEELTKNTIPSIQMGGGAIQNEVFCQFTANATNKKVKAGPVEASAIGNAISQFITIGAISDITEAKKVVQNSFEMNDYFPEESDIWEKHYQDFLKFMNGA